jgi:Zn-dependent protease
MGERGKRTARGATASVAGYAGWKGLKFLVPLLKLLKLAKLAKLAGSAGSMLLSIAVYSLTYGWRYATGFVVLLLVHELGHYASARRAGLNVGLPAFIPFVGAWIQLKDGFPDVETEARIAIAGPLLGTTAALAVFVAWYVSQAEILLALAYAGFILNLFNLIPVSPLDGGRVAAVISPWLWLVGLPILAAVFFYHPNGLLLIIGVLAIPQIMAVFKKRNDPAMQRYHAAPLSTRLGYGILYLGLIGMLSVLSQWSYDTLNLLHQG